MLIKDYRVEISNKNKTKQYGKKKKIIAVTETLAIYSVMVLHLVVRPALSISWTALARCYIKTADSSSLIYTRVQQVYSWTVSRSSNNCECNVSIIICMFCTGRRCTRWWHKHLWFDLKSVVKSHSMVMPARANKQTCTIFPLTRASIIYSQTATHPKYSITRHNMKRKQATKSKPEKLIRTKLTLSYFYYTAVSVLILTPILAIQNDYYLQWL